MKGEGVGVLVLIPTLNEEATIGEVIRGFKREGLENILVMDGNSTDNTREIAAREEAEVMVQQGKGKGAAVKQAFEVINEEVDVIVMIDGDGTYSPSEVGKLVAPIVNGEADHVIGNRFAHGGAFSKTHKIGNKIVNQIFNFGYGTELNDILSGYRAFTKGAVKRMDLQKTGFELETEMTVELVKKGFRIKEVPIRYAIREGRSKLNIFKDGSRIVYTLYTLTRTHNPIFYFGVIGSLFIVVGFLCGIYVVMEWYKRIPHDLLTVFVALMIISGIQFLIFGLLGDLIIKMQKETVEALMSSRGER